MISSGLVCCLVLFSASIAVLASPVHNDDASSWESFKTKYNKKYSSPSEEYMRKANFDDRKEFIKLFNEKSNASFTLGINSMADWTSYERDQLLGHSSVSNHFYRKNTPEAERFLDGILNANSGEVPDELDWRQEAGRVSSVKNVGKSSLVVIVIFTTR